MRTINDIIPPSRRREPESLINTNEPLPREPLRLSKQPSSFPYKTLTVAFIVIALSIASLFYFSTAKIEIVPNTIGAAVQSPFTATNQGTSNLSYEIITSQKIASQGIPSNGTKIVHSFASGPLTIYNKQQKSQKLIANTRFMTPGGAVFRIHEAVVIPASSAGKEGSVTVTAYADKTGDSYNISPTSFTIPGFIGTPLADKVYAQSTDTMTGGASGAVPVVDTVLETQTRTTLMTALTPELNTDLQSKVPSGYILLPGSTKTIFKEPTSTPSPTTGQVEVKEQGTITAVVFPNNALAKAIASSIQGLGYQGEPLSLLPASNLQLSSSGLPDTTAAPFTFTLTGTASLAYIIDSNRIATTVAGKTSEAARVAITNYPEVKSAIITLRPFWRQTFPQDPASITVTVARP